MPVLAYRNLAGLILNIGGDPVFQARVTKSLNKIGQTDAGVLLFNGIQENRAARYKFVTVHPPGPNGISECACVEQDSSVTRTRLAQAIFDGRPAAQFQAELNHCLNAAGHANDAMWLANLINATPVYDIRGIPNAIPSNLGVTPAQVANWLNGLAPFPNPFVEPQVVSALKMALLVALWPQARLRPGNGGHSIVRWRSESHKINLTIGVEQRRSKSIGLAHELVHAYYNGCGLQMGLDNPLPDGAGVPTVPSAALYEYMCVGLGIWNAEEISENAIRRGWHRVMKNRLLGKIPVYYGETLARPCY